MNDKDKTKEELLNELTDLQQKYNSVKELLEKDLDQHKTAGENLEESDSQFRILMDSAADGIFIADSKSGIILDANQAASHMMLIPIEKIKGLHQSELHPPEDIEYSKETFTRHKDEIKQLNYSIPVESKLLRSDGTELEIEILASKVIFKGTECIMGTFRDITERKKAEKALRENEANLKAIIENSLESIWSIDTDYKIQYVNKVFADAFQQTFGIELKKGVNILNSLPEPLSGIWKERYNRTFRNERISFTDEINLGNHTVFIEVAMNPIVVDGIVVGASFYGRDITESKKAEDSLRESEERFRTLSSIAKEGLMIHEDGIILEANQAFAGILGYSSPDVLIGKKGIEACNFTPESEQIVRQHLVNNSNETFDVEIIDLTGNIISAETKGEEIMYLGRKARLVYMRDITDRKKIEQELIDSKEKAEESDRLKSAFLANMSHEIRTPMNGILGFLDLLRMPNLNEENRREYFDIVKMSSNRLLETINAIIEMSKIESGASEISFSNFDLTELMNTHFNFFKLQAKEKNLKLKIGEQITGPSSMIISDKHKIDGIFLNLIKNAIKFTGKGDIEIGNYIDNDSLVLFVKDTGIGIHPDQHEEIFERFNQVEKGLTRDHEGSGLGLSISKAYVESLSGEIWLDSELGKGSSFYFSIPYRSAYDSKISKKIIQEETHISNQGLTILIAEDDETSFKLIEAILDSEHVNLVHALSGEDAVKILKDKPETSLILMDIKMPGMNGLEATREIRKFNKSIPIIAQTSFAMQGDREKAIEAGCSDYISKPIKHNELIKLINKYSQNKS